ncbi:hypothetical protein PT110_09705, partial [Erysipelothrix rhusiopathiae]|nr:hypothetical protein [Erysipelothrix rhusiopathiae]
SASFTVIPMLVPIKYANLLGVKLESPILSIESIIYKNDGSPLFRTNTQKKKALLLYGFVIFASPTLRAVAILDSVMK